MTLFDKLAHVAARRTSYWGERISAEINYAARLSSVNADCYNELIERAADYILEQSNAEGVITRTIALEAEEMLMPISKKAKEIKVYCVSHAHIDMNWMWGYQETVGITIDTFRTVLQLMKEYPDFTFSQSQASVYKIVEEHDPDMLEEIKQRIKEGRWEITASTWVETDKNMPNGESLARHILYTKKYLSKLMDVSEDSMQLDFEPDTFGHNWTIPEIMTKGGVKYYYHCRAYDGEYVYRWQSRSGAEVLVYREPQWYNAEIVCDMMSEIPQFCDKYGINVMMKVYGVGDHGGGPTRRDIERIIEIGSWPIQPTIVFGTYHAFYAELDKFRANLPVVNQELNYIFTGCYTSQTRVKMSNRISEDKLYAAEAIGALATNLGGRSYAPSFAKAWENVLFNHFHDILPGSGKVETREYALGNFQRVMAVANTNITNATNLIASKIDTSSIPFEADNHTNSEGAGAGWAVDQANRFQIPQTERGRGKVRAFTVFNPTEFERNAPVELTVWDWYYDHSLISFKDSAGNEIPFKITHGVSGFWAHAFFKVAIMVKVPAFGYATYTLTERSRPQVQQLSTILSDRQDYISDDDIVMANDKVKAVFDAETMMLKSYIDLSSGEEMICPKCPSAFFRMIQEDDVNGMTAWRVGPYMTVQNINDTCDVRVYDKNLWGIRKWVRYEVKFRSSVLNVTISLDDNSKSLKFDIAVDWHEIGRPGSGVPQLNFFLPLGYNADKYRYDIPYATIERGAINHDVPGNSFAAAINENGKSAVIYTDTKYGFRGTDNSLAVDLIRSSYDPDPYPELGKHNISLAVAIADNLCNKTLFEMRDEFIQILPYVSMTKHTGDLPLDKAFITAEGDIRIAAIKTKETDKDITVIRLHGANGSAAEGKLTFTRDLSAACLLDINENMIEKLAISGSSVTVKIAPYEVVTLAVKF